MNAIRMHLACDYMLKCYVKMDVVCQRMEQLTHGGGDDSIFTKACLK